MLTILNVGQNYHVRGGSDRYMLALGRLLEARGHRVVPFAAAHATNQATEWGAYFPARVDFEHPGAGDLLRYLYNAGAGRSLGRLITAASPDIAHLHIYYGQLTTAILRELRRRRVPVVQTLHEYKLVCPTHALAAGDEICEDCRGSAFWHAIARRCNRGSLARSALSAAEAYLSRALGARRLVDRFIAVSDFQRRKLIELGVEADRVVTIHNFIDATGIARNRAPGAHFLYFGRIERIKGLWTLVDAAKLVPEVPLLIAGTGSGAAALRAYVRERGLEHVRFLGFVQGEALARLIRESICTITPSLWYETFGLTLLESFAHCRPVIASAIGGMPEVVADGGTGFLVPPGDVAALAERLDWMARHRAEAVAMGLRAREQVEREFAPEQHYQRLLAVYASALG
jgi:glycosyltransferase involved in cell wall biosynthesis